MTTIADTHVHIYPEYDVALFLECACRNLDRAARQGGGAPAGESTRVLFLTESAGCDWHALAGQGTLPAGWTKNATSHPLCLVLQHERHGTVHCVPGRQTATRERLEILGLAMREVIPDGLPVNETLDKVQQAGGVPVLPWALGKWLFGRGRMIKGLLQSSSPDRFLIGDSAMRPSPSPLPSLMRMARQRGFGLVAGSDPLPLRGEEGGVGTYATVCDASFDPGNPAEFLRILASSTSARRVGRRCGLWAVFKKMMDLRSRKQHFAGPKASRRMGKHS